MKVIIKILFLIFALSKTVAKEKFTVGTRFRAIECNGDNESLSFEYCDVKAYSAKVAVLNIGLKVLQTIQKPFYVQIIYSYRFGNIYRPMVDSKRIEFCAIMDGVTGNPIIKLFTDDLIKAYPNLLHKCPFEKGVLNMKNLTTAGSGVSKMMPRGLFKIDVSIVKNTKEIANLKIFYENKSNLESW